MGNWKALPPDYCRFDNLHVLCNLRCGLYNYFFCDPVELSLSLLLKTHFKAIHEGPSGKTCLSGCDLSPATLLDFRAYWLTFTSWYSPVVAFQFDLRQLCFSYCKRFEENIDNSVVTLITFFSKLLDFWGLAITNPRIFFFILLCNLFPLLVALKSKTDSIRSSSLLWRCSRAVHPSTDTLTIHFP